MTSAEQQLARIGFGRRSSERPCWRVVRLDEPAGRDVATAPECSCALMRWRVLLAREARQSPYRVSRVGS
jgi:hypothetical protein